MPGFNPNRLREMRIVRRMTLDQLAGLLGITKQAVSKYEHGKSIPSSDVIDKMLDVLNMPRKYLLKDDIAFDSRCSNLFFRTMNSTTKGNVDYADIVSHWGYEILCGLVDFQKNQAAFPEIDVNLSIPEKVMELRQQWDIGILPINNITELLESNGFFIFVIDSTEIKTDAYSRVINGIPIIVINNNKGTAVRWRFNLAHELGHLILHRELSKLDFDIRSDDIEREANLFAEHFLMPIDGFRNSVIASKLEHFIPLKREWGVSVAAMVYHCKQIGLFDSHKVKSLQIQISKQGWNKNEPLDDEIEFENPKKLLQIMSKQVHDINSFNKFYDTVRLPIGEIERLCSLPERYFSTYQNENIFEEDLHYTYQSEYEQMSLFPEGGGFHA